MFVVRRRAGEAIAIGSGIEVCILEISPTRVKLGIVAPREMPVIRRETSAVAEENRLAAQFAGSRGAEGLREFAGILARSAVQAKTVESPADKKHVQDTPGIAAKGENPLLA